MAIKIEGWDTLYSADSVEFCPIVGFHNILAVGTYQVDKSNEDRFESSQRKGRLHLLMLDDAGKLLECLQTLETAAILDMKWSSFQDSPPMLALADSKGIVTVYKLTDDRLNIVSSKSIVSHEETLALSLDWNDRRLHRESKKIAVSDSRGNVSILDLESMEVTNRLENQHEFECWITAFDSWDDAVVYSGGDDCRMNVYDLRCLDNGAVKANRRQHSAGVTSLLSDLYHENVFYSGSYDESVNSWDKRTLKQPLESRRLDGGVWRIRQPQKMNLNLLATATMHNGFHVLNANNLSILGRYEEHQSLAYGVDFSPKTGNDDLILLASCSFYDHYFTTWNFIKPI